MLLIVSMGIFIIFASYSAFDLLSRSEPENIVEYIKLLSLLSSGYLGFIILKLFQKLNTTSNQYLIELKKFNSQIIKIRSGLPLED
jgi:hypothetical protein